MIMNYITTCYDEVNENILEFHNSNHLSLGKGNKDRESMVRFFSLFSNEKMTALKQTTLVKYLNQVNFLNISVKK